MRVVLAAVPVVLVNVVAFAGQLAFLREHLPWVPAGQVLMAVTLEVIAVYLAWQAHLAQLANDSALRLRLAAYGFALLIAAMNYSHYAGPGWSPTFVAVAVALCSAASPWLWGIHTRRASRDKLMARGLVEPHALRLGGTRWTWHPVRSARVMWLATWEGITDPRAAVARLDRSAGTVSEPVKVTEGRPPSEWLDDQILALLPRMSVRSTAQALGVSKTRVETAKRRAALTVPDERGRGGVTQPAPAPAAGERSRDGGHTRPRAVPAAQAPAGAARMAPPAPAGAELQAKAAANGHG